MCDCRAKMDNELRASNCRVSIGLLIIGNALVARPVVATEKLDKSKRKPPPQVFASYCPFCGESLAIAARGGE